MLHTLIGTYVVFVLRVSYNKDLNFSVTGYHNHTLAIRDHQIVFDSETEKSQKKISTGTSLKPVSVAP